jgi:hypothetical protein
LDGGRNKMRKKKRNYSDMFLDTTIIVQCKKCKRFLSLKDAIGTTRTKKHLTIIEFYCKDCCNGNGEKQLK